MDLITSRQLRKQAGRKYKTVMYVVRRVKESKECVLDLPPCPDRFKAVIARHAKAFRSTLPDKPPPAELPSHGIELNEGASPVNIGAYGLTFEKQLSQKEQIVDLLEKGLIRPSSSPWGSPVLFVSKPDGTWQMCIDYRELNDRTRKNTYPIPRVQECLDRIGKAKRMTKIDLTSGFWQIGMDPNSVELTAFNTRMGKFEFLVMPFGLTNAPATFQTRMNNILREYIDDYVIVYLDDILILSNSDEEHELHLDMVLSALERNHLFAKPSKCTIGVSEVDFCGFIVGNGQIKTQCSKTDLVKNWPVPSTIHDVRAFLGLASYYRRFVKGFATISAPLSDLLKEEDAVRRAKKHRPVVWTDRAQIAFDTLKACLTSEPILVQPDPYKPYRIETDASAFAMGYVLLQSDDNGFFHPVALDGRKLQAAELNYSVQEKELLAIKCALRTWDHYVRNNQLILIITDHKSLAVMTTTKVQSSRLERWLDEFGGYNLEINYRPGVEAILPDTISRREDFEEREAPPKSNLTSFASGFSSIHSFDEDEWLSALIQYLKTGELPANDSLSKCLQSDKYHPASSFEYVNETLYKIHSDGSKAPFLASSGRRAYLDQIHRDYGHLGWPGLSEVVKTRAWFPSIEPNVRRITANCPNCLSSKGSAYDQHRGAPTRSLERKDIGVFKQWSLDLVGPLPWSFNGKRWIITAIDRATGWPVAQAVEDATSETVIDFIHTRIFALSGIPHEILTDNGQNLVSNAMETYLRPTEVRHRKTTPYHPQTNGKIERFNGTIGKMLAKYLFGKSVRHWDEYVEQALFAVRIRTHATSKYSPFFLLYGIHPRLPGDEPQSLSNESKIDELIDRFAKANEARIAANTALVDKAIQAGLIDADKVHLPELSISDYVLVRNESHKKLQPKWFGPYKIIAVSPLGTYAIEDCNSRVVRDLINGNRLMKFPSATVTSEGKWKEGMSHALKSRDSVRPPSPEETLLERHAYPAFTYKELSTITKKEWVDALNRGLSKSRLSEGRVDGTTIEAHIYKKLCERADKADNSELFKRSKELQIETASNDIPSISQPEPIDRQVQEAVRKAAPLLDRSAYVPPPIEETNTIEVDTIDSSSNDTVSNDIDSTPPAVVVEAIDSPESISPSNYGEPLPPQDETVKKIRKKRIPKEYIPRTERESQTYSFRQRPTPKIRFG